MEKFKPVDKPEFITEETMQVTTEVVNVLKQKGLTYAQAYEVLQNSYDQLRYESNFLKLD